MTKYLTFLIFLQLFFISILDFHLCPFGYVWFGYVWFLLLCGGLCCSHLVLTSSSVTHPQTLLFCPILKATSNLLLFPFIYLAAGEYVAAPPTLCENLWCLLGPSTYESHPVISSLLLGCHVVWRASLESPSQLTLAQGRFPSGVLIAFIVFLFRLSWGE